jgi:uncharacterized membrane protein
LLGYTHAIKEMAIDFAKEVRKSLLALVAG